MKLRRETIVVVPAAASPSLAEHLKSLAEYPPCQGAYNSGMRLLEISKQPLEFF
jgi:hypothetical protein